MGDDLYNTGNQVTPVATTNNNTGGGIIDISIFDLNSVLYWLNVVVLAWTIFYSLVLIYEFVFYRIKYPDGELVEREEVGVNAINQAAGMWWGFLACTLLYFCYFVWADGLIKQLFGWVAIFSYLIKVLIIDMPNIPVIGKFLGKPGEGVQNFVSDISGNTKSFFGGIVDGLVSALGGGS